MIPMIGYDLSYQRRAFTSKIDPDGLPRMALESSVKHAARMVYSRSERRWLITIKAGFVPFDMNEPVELMVIVPAGSNQYEQYLAAVKEFEDCIAESPGANPISPALRTIEEGSPKCEDCESRTIAWIRTTPNAGNERYFCNEHAERQSDFGGNAATNPDNFMYVRQHPHRVRITT
jgi:hypothetical protein